MKQNVRSQLNQVRKQIVLKLYQAEDFLLRILLSKNIHRSQALPLHWCPSCIEEFLSKVHSKLHVPHGVLHSLVK